jgi:hypothetical protein
MSAFSTCNSDSSRNQLNARFIHILESTLSFTEAMEYPFGKLKNLVKLSSPDGRFRIIHWNLQDDKRIHHYYGYLLLKAKSGFTVTELHDIRHSLAGADSLTLNVPEWFGALYYQIIPVTSRDGMLTYTLLGWSGTNSAITRKVIEVLWFDNNNNAVFGRTLFRGHEWNSKCRVLFSYSATTTMSMKYRPPDRIIFDRLGPIDPALEGQHQFYTGSGEAFDGFLLKNGFWEFTTGLSP